MSRPETVVYIATTVDGFIARPDGGLDWLDHDAGGEDYGWQAFREGLDSLVLGRNTYEQVLSFGVPWPYKGLSTVVWSRTLTTADLPVALRDQGVEVSALPPAELLGQLGDRGLRRVWIDGGRTVQAFLAAGLVDLLTVTRIPILIGAGVPLFGPMPGDAQLGHVQTASFASGVVQSAYSVQAVRTS